MTEYFSYKVGRCTAEYSKLPQNKIKVENKCIDGDSGNATAYAQNGNNATLSVDFELNNWFSVFAKGNYYVLYLEEGKNEETGEPQYQTVVVGEPCKDLLWILTRKEKVDPLVVANAVKLAEDQGYNTKKLIYRNTDCSHESSYAKISPKVSAVKMMIK